MSLLRKLDHGIYRVERALAAWLFLALSLVMFTNVLHRIYSRPEGRLSSALLSLLGGLGVEADPTFIHGPVSLGLNLALTFLISYGVFRTMEGRTQFTRVQSLGGAVVATAGAAGLVKLLLVLAPNGLVWAPMLALAGVLWVGFLGASMATYEGRHLSLEMGDKIWPAKLLPFVKALAMLTTAALGAFLLTLAVLSISIHYREWVVNHLADNLLLTDIPKWVVFLIFPYTFAMMTLRFLGQAVAAAQGKHQPEATP